MNLLIILICYIGLVILSLFIYNAYLFNQKMKCAYIVELKNSNPNILVQTKVKVTSKKTIRVGTCKIEDNIVEVVLGNKPLDSIKTVFFNNKKNKYYSSRKSSKDVSFDTVLNSEKNIYLYKLKSRNDTFVRETDENFEEKELVMFKNPFDNTIYFESEVGDKEVITEVDLINKIPKELDKYFFDGKSISSLYEVQSKSTLDILKPTSISIGVVLIIFYIFTNVF